MMQHWNLRLKQAMNHQGLTQYSLAKKMKVSRGLIGNYLTGRRHPTMRRFQTLANALQVNPIWLQYGKMPDMLPPLIHNNAPCSTARAYPLQDTPPIKAALHHLTPFCVIVANDLLAPKLQAGMTVTIDPNCPVQNNAYALIYHQAGDYFFLRQCIIEGTDITLITTQTTQPLAFDSSQHQLKGKVIKSEDNRF